MEDCFLDLEVDVNGEEVFVVNKRVISSYSGKISKLVGKSEGVARRLKVIFDDFPGGAASFELITRFCYNKGGVIITPLNIFNLSCAANFMEMDDLRDLTEKSLQEISYWSWHELLAALKQCQELLPRAGSLALLDKCLDSLIGRVASSCETSPSPSVSSSDSSGFRLSCDTRSTESLKSSAFRATWWFEDLVGLGTDLIQTLVKSMVAKNLDNGIISRFLFYYQKSRCASASADEKIKIIETVVDLLESLDARCVSYKSLFGLLRVGLNASLKQCSRDKLESMIGSQLDQATLDDLLVPSPVGTSCLYDVNLVLRFLKAFLGKGVCCVPLSRLRKVAALMDLFLAEVAPDPHLKPSKFLALIISLPDSARDSCDGVYYAVNLYLEVHSGLSEEQKTKVCRGLTYEKLSPRALDHLTRNAKFPPKSTVQAVASQQNKLKGLLQDTSSPLGSRRDEEGSKQVVLYAKKFNLTDENEKLKAHLQGMQWRVLELEKVCRKMQVQMTKVMKSRMGSHSSAKSVPRLCS
ncbi:BTB/POZ domain-containing protein At3g22104-like [Salvia miltiorrhiza]|uniref:BTB/POZ domain-containing protein At3g22104-like n=1 Tax=Salvia miltiorrhiza TaxID=226208 RepID=UPI0025AC1170|nr:BTB/POZ domain-containing protein At3g22104-like [Salvia miltiorrhiza]